MNDWNFDEYCAKTAAELQLFLPSRVFDAHAHPGEKSELDLKRVSILNELPQDVGIATWREFTSLHVGKERLKGGLFFALPLFDEQADIRQSMRRANDFVVSDLRNSGEAKSKCLLLVSRLLKPSDVEEPLKEDCVCGFKPYVTLSPGCDASSRISDFVPDWVFALAHERELVITLHIQKHGALSDAGNIRDIHEICKKYPNMKLILAHCGCSFNVYNTLNGAKYYTDIDNIYFDTSALCEGLALTHMFKLFAANRFMWGTDFPISVRHGRFVGLGDFVFSLQNNTVDGGNLPDNIMTMHQGLESLRALVYAIKESGLSDSEVEGIFYDNAANLLGIQ